MKPTKPKPSGKLVLPKVGIMSLNTKSEEVLRLVLDNAPQNTIKRIDYVSSEDDLRNSLYGVTLLFVIAEYLEKRIFDIFELAESIGIFCVLSLPDVAKDGIYYKKIAVLLSRENDSSADEAKNIISICKFYSAEYNKDCNNITYDTEDMRIMMPKAYTSLLFRRSLDGVSKFIKNTNILHNRGVFLNCVYNGNMNLVAVQQAMGSIYNAVHEDADVFYGVYHDLNMPTDSHIVEVFTVEAML